MIPPVVDGGEWLSLRVANIQNWQLDLSDAKHVDVVVRYIDNQEAHHRRLSFQDEFRTFLERYQVAYDERYVWD
jgi:hypothetical protein